MKRILLIIALFAIAVPGFSQFTIKDENAEVRPAKDFTVIRVSNAFDVYLSQGNEESVAVSAATAKYLEEIIVEVKNGVLEISYHPKNGRWTSGNRKLKAYISFKQLDKLKVSGACDVNIIGGWKTEGARVELSGASDLKGQLTMQKLSVDISGASDMQVTGTVGQLDIEASGASNFKGFDLAADYCDARASGASDIRIHVNKELSVQASGASDVDYKGEGHIRDIKTSGSSSVKRRNS
jgi:hypothetical protein